MKGDKPNPTAEQGEKVPSKVPMIRLKIKVPSTDNKNEPPAPKHESSTTKLVDTLPKFYGTFKYRPFKLFPLLPPCSRYRVLIPAKHTRFASNPAVRLDYLWETGREGVYTDDSDLLCVLLRERWLGLEAEGKSILVEVEVVDINDRRSGTTRRSEDSKVSGGAKVSIDTSDSNTSKTTDHSTTQNLQSLVTPRVYASEHHGHHIRVTACTVNPSAVHLKRWRKRRNHRDSQLVTPKFKTIS